MKNNEKHAAMNPHCVEKRFIKADYVSTPVKRTLLGIIYKVVTLLFLFIKGRHIDRIVGLENLPSRGPFIVVANHLSYMDDFLVAYVISRYYGEKLYIPTNKKAFKGAVRNWLHLAGGAVEIDPDDRVKTYGVLRQLIEDKKIILIFPEGTRSDGSNLLPFKFGAFNLAKELQVAIAPVALIDTHKVLPKHHLRLVKGEKASVAFLPVIEPSVFEHNDLEQVKEACRNALIEQIYGKREWSAAAAGEATACHLAERAEHQIEALIERGPETIRGMDLTPVFGWAELAHYSQATLYAMEVQYFRAWGFHLMASPKPLALFLLAKFRTLGVCALGRDPHQPFVHYVRGQFHMRAPWILGGRKRLAMAAMDHAYRWAGRYHVARERFAISYAETLLQNGFQRRALRILQRHFSNADISSARLKRRFERASELLKRTQ